MTLIRWFGDWFNIDLLMHSSVHDRLLRLTCLVCCLIIMQCDGVGCDVDADEDKTPHSRSFLMAYSHRWDVCASLFSVTPLLSYLPRTWCSVLYVVYDRFCYGSDRAVTVSFASVQINRIVSLFVICFALSDKYDCRRLFQLVSLTGTKGEEKKHTHREIDIEVSSALSITRNESIRMNNGPLFFVCSHESSSTMGLSTLENGKHTWATFLLRIRMPPFGMPEDKKAH